jgi:hypothetical protein
VSGGHPVGVGHAYVNGGHLGGSRAVGRSFVSPGHFGGRYGSHLFLGPGGSWGGRAHWGNGFWARGQNGWVGYPGRWWVSPAYPGWVWMGEPWVWDGTQWLSQDGYWTTADVPEEESQDSVVEPTDPGTPPAAEPLLPSGPPPAGPPSAGPLRAAPLPDGPLPEEAPSIVAPEGL